MMTDLTRLAGAKRVKSVIILQAFRYIYNISLLF